MNGNYSAPIGFIDNDEVTTSLYHMKIQITGINVHIYGNNYHEYFNSSGVAVQSNSDKMAIYKIVGFK